MEFGLGEALPLYAGGLGVLAGDYLKAASDLAVPVTAIGLLYQEGYFRQVLDGNGWQ
jgi:starch phosphorylase